MPSPARRSCRWGWRWAGSIATWGPPEWWRGQRGTCWSLRRGFRAARCSDRSCPRSAGASSSPARQRWSPGLCSPPGSPRQIFYEVPPFELFRSKVKNHLLFNPCFALFEPPEHWLPAVRKMRHGHFSAHRKSPWLKKYIYSRVYK